MDQNRLIFSLDIVFRAELILKIIIFTLGLKRFGQGEGNEEKKSGHFLNFRVPRKIGKGRYPQKCEEEKSVSLLSCPLLALRLGEYWFRISLYVYDRNRPLAPILRQRRCSLIYDVY